jgi:hypothetical protein
MPHLHTITLICSTDHDLTLLRSLLLAVGERSGARWMWRDDTSADVVLVDTDSHESAMRLPERPDAVVVGFGLAPHPQARYHLPKPIRMRALMELLRTLVREQFAGHSENAASAPETAQA